MIRSSLHYGEKPISHRSSVLAAMHTLGSNLALLSRAAEMYEGAPHPRAKALLAQIELETKLTRESLERLDRLFPKIAHEVQTPSSDTSMRDPK